MVDTELRHRAELVRHFCDVPLARGNASRLEQVFVNVLLNALQSLSRDESRREQIEVTIEPWSGGVAIAIRDTGHGVAPDVLPRLFDPFFTTKPIGEGMGLGLAVAKGIVEGFGGTIEIASTEGVGTIVTIRLRTHVSVEGAAPRVIAPAPTPPRLRLLVVDDEPLVRQVIGSALGDHHDVTTAESGEAALAAISAASFDVIICDMMMPGMSGRELHRRIAHAHPSLEQRFVFITGGSLAVELDAFLASAGVVWLSKPFKIEQLDALIAQVVSA
jgi:CheY-like chemotaxis protein/anti-sigma regulatory factor (Ser/Thr protein kinase)